MRWLVCALLIGCAPHDHDHGVAAPAAQGHAHADEQGLTAWGEAVQAFVAAPPLRVGEEARLLVHLTRLADHRPHPARTARVTLEGAGARLHAEATPGDTAGILIATVRPVTPGEYALTVEVAGEQLPLGAWMVHAAGAHPPARPEPVGAISLTVEQQWQQPFGLDRVAARTVRPSIPAFARLVLPNDAESLVAAPHAGRLVRIGEQLPIVGAAVERGDPLFGTIPQEGGDPATLDLAVEKAEIQQKAAAREVARLRPLVSEGVVAKRRLDEALSALSRARAGLRGAERHRSSMGHSQRIDGTVEVVRVPSPIQGTIAEIFVTPGAWVTAGQPIARIVDPRRLWLEVAVPEVYVDRLRTVAGVWFRIGGITRELRRDALVSIGAEVDRASRTLPVLFRLDNADRALYAGMAAEAHLIGETPREVPTVPVSAIVDDGGTDVVFVQTGGETFERRVVRLGVRDGDVVEVEGVAPGDWIVSRGAWAVKLAGLQTDSLGHGHAH